MKVKKPKVVVPPVISIEKQIIPILSVALNYIENAYQMLNFFVENEDSLNEVERERYYDYGRDTLDMSLVRLVNVKKSLLAITGNKRIVEKVA